MPTLYLIFFFFAFLVVLFLLVFLFVCLILIKAQTQIQRDDTERFSELANSLVAHQLPWLPLFLKQIFSHLQVIVVSICMSLTPQLVQSLSVLPHSFYLMANILDFYIENKFLGCNIYVLRPQGMLNKIFSSYFAIPFTNWSYLQQSHGKMSFFYAAILINFHTNFIFPFIVSLLLLLETEVWCDSQ